jgi:uncharacterized membrane protein SirB2
MTYLALKHFHMSMAALSIALFLVRGAWRMMNSPRLQRAWVSRVPHLVDSLLLGSALGLSWWSGMSPAGQPWLAAKIVALIAYIALGSVALKYGRTPLQRTTAFAAALVSVGYIVLTAITKNPLFFL